MRISDWSSDVCSSDLRLHHAQGSSVGWLRPRSRKLPVAIPPPRLTRERAFWRSRCRIDENGPQTAFGPDVAAYVCGTCADRIIRYDRYHYGRCRVRIRSCRQAGGVEVAASTGARSRSEEHTSELQSLMRIS